MPGFDGSGPMGAGPMTGGARGYCNPPAAGYGRPIGYGRGMGYSRGYGRGYGRGYNFGRGFGRGVGPGYYGYVPIYGQGPIDELTALKQQADDIKNTLDAINSRIAELQNAD